MKYNFATFFPDHSTANWDVNSLNANFKLALANYFALEELDKILAGWTKYSEATFQDSIEASDLENLLYHEGIVYSGLITESIPLDGGSLTMQPGSIVYCIDLSKDVADPTRYLVIDNPVRLGFNETITNGQISWRHEELNTYKRNIRGPMGAHRWDKQYSFGGISGMSGWEKKNKNNTQWQIPLTNIHTGATSDNVFNISFYEDDSNTPDFTKEVVIQHSFEIKPIVNEVNHEIVDYLVLTFYPSNHTAWNNLFTLTPLKKLWLYIW